MFLGKIKKFVLLVVVFLFAFSSVVSAADMPTNEELLKEIRDLKKIVKAQGEKIDQMEERYCEYHMGPKEKAPGAEDGEIVENDELAKDIRRRLERLGTAACLDIGAGATFIGQGTPNANNSIATDGAESRFDGSYKYDFDISRKFGDFGRAYIHFEGGSGNTITDELDVFSPVNNNWFDTNSTPRAREVWYEQYLFNKQVTITAGKIDGSSYIDGNEYASDDATQFLGHMFNHSDAITWPVEHSIGGRVYIDPDTVLPYLDATVVYMDANDQWENIVKNPFIAAQVNFTPADAFGYDKEKWDGNYRMYFWYNNLAVPKIKTPGELDRGNFGFGLSADQKLTDIYGVFARAGWQDPSLSNIAFAWSIGGQMIGEYWKRPEDVIGVGFGQAIPGDDYSDMNEFHKIESHLEAYYAFKINKHLTISPDMQVIWDANGGGTNLGEKKDRPIFVYGLRGRVDL